MRALIVGCGYLGLQVGAELVKLGHQVCGLKRHWTSDEVASTGITAIQADITRPESLARLVPNFDWMINCVSSTHGGPEEYRSVYWQGMRNLLAWFAAAPPSRFVYTSSTSVYGQNDGSTVTEQSPVVPSAETARILLATEQLLLEDAASTSATGQVVILRLAGIYGPGRGYWFKQFMNGTARIEGEGGRIFNMIHRDDAAGAVVTTLQHASPSAVYNVVDDAPVTQFEFFHWLSQRLNRPLPPFAPEAEPAERKRPHTNKRISNLKLKTEMQYRFKYPTFREGFEADFSSMK